MNEEDKPPAGNGRAVVAPLMVVIVGVIVVCLVMLSVSNHRLGQANTRLNDRNNQLVQKFESCTAVGGDCYERTHAALAKQIQVDIAVAQCADKTDTDADLNECVAHYLAVPQPTVGPAIEPPVPAPPSMPEPSPGG